MLMIHHYGCPDLIVPCRGGSKLLGLNPLELLHRQATLVELIELLLATLICVSSATFSLYHIFTDVRVGAYFLLLLVLRSSLQHGSDVVRES